MEKLRKRGVAESVIALERKFIIEVEGEITTNNPSSGVPQGSVLEPFLWNMLYDGLRRIQHRIIIIATARTEEILTLVANIAIQKIINWLESMKLKLTPNKADSSVNQQNKIVAYGAHG